MRKSKKLMGGFWDNLSGYFGKKDTKPSNTSTVATTSSQPLPPPPPSSDYQSSASPTSSSSSSYTSQGGRRRKRKMRGGKYVSYSMADLASTAGSYSNNSTAKAHMVGGKRRTKSRKSASRQTRRKR